MTRFQLIASICSLLQIFTPALCVAASIPTESSRRIGLLRLNGGDASSYHLLEQRLRRWLENDPSLSLEVTPVDDANSERGSLLELQKLTSKLSAADATGEDSAKLRAEFEARLVAAQKSGEGGPILQEALVRKAMLEWRGGDRAGAETTLRLAVLLNPAGQLRESLASDWDWESSAENEPFLALVREAQEGVVRSCRVELALKPVGAEVFVNGFSTGHAKQLDLVPGIRYTVRASSPGFDSLSQELSCPSTGKRVAQLSLQAQPPRGLPDSAELRRVSETNDVRSLVLIRSEKDRYRLYLYTPGISIDELPLRKPLTAKEVAESETLPIAADRFSALLDKHRLASSQLALGPSTSAVSGEGADWTGARLTERADTGRWYTSGTFWAIAGTIAAGALIAYLSTRGHSPETQRGVSYTINNGH